MKILQAVKNFLAYQNLNSKKHYSKLPEFPGGIPK